MRLFSPVSSLTLTKNLGDQLQFDLIRHTKEIFLPLLVSVWPCASEESSEKRLEQHRYAVHHTCVILLFLVIDIGM